MSQRDRMAVGALVATLLAGLPLAHADRADELARLAGHRVALTADGGYQILDVAGLGRPRVGVVELRANQGAPPLALQSRASLPQGAPPLALQGRASLPDDAETLWLVPTDQDAGQPAVRLTGRLAVPRLLGPGYKVWVLASPREGSLTTIRPIRFGVLARPARATPVPPSPAAPESR